MASTNMINVIHFRKYMASCVPSSGKNSQSLLTLNNVLKRKSKFFRGHGGISRLGNKNNLCSMYYKKELMN